MGIGNFTENITHQGEHIEDIIKYTTIDKVPEPIEYPCVYGKQCGDYCPSTKSPNCDEYKRRERLRSFFIVR